MGRPLHGPGNGNDSPLGLAVSSDSTRAYVTGQSAGSTSFDYATVAYATG